MQRIREECNDRFATERNALRRQLRGHTTDPAEIRETIRSVYRQLDEVDIDKLLEEFLVSMYDHPPDEYDADLLPTNVPPADWVRCPLCGDGFAIVPVPGVIVCDHCPNLRIATTNEGLTVADFANSLDACIKAHPQHSVEFIINDNVLFAKCQTCNSLDVLV